MKQKTARHWITVALCCGVFASSIGICGNSMGVFYTPVSESLGIGRGTFAMSATLAGLLAGFFSPVVARWMGKYPLRPIMLFGVLLCSGCIALMSLTRNIWVFYLLGVLRGVGTACFSMIPVTTIISNWFELKHGLAMGLAMSFSGVSGAVFSPLFTSVIQWVGWEKAFLCMALFALVLALPGALFLRAKPEDVSLLPYGAVKRPETPAAAVPQTGSSKKTLVFSGVFAVLALTSLLPYFTTGLAQHFPGYAETVGLTAGVGALMVSAGMVGNIVGKLIIGVLSDKFGPFVACSVMMVVHCLALGGLALMPHGVPAAALALAFLYGAVYSVTAVGVSVVTRRLFGVENYASVYSVVTAITCVGSSCSLTVVGAIYDVSGTYNTAIVLCMVMGLVSLVGLAYLARQAKKGAVRR